jgi:hypothetical protein
MICGCGEVRLVIPFPPCHAQWRVGWRYIDIDRRNIGAMLEEPIKEGDSGPPKMKGSAMLIGAKTREEVVERLKQDVYVQQGVWDVEKVEIIPFKSALRKAL